MTARDIAIKELEAAGYSFKRHGCNHDQYYNPESRNTISVKRHKFTENTLRYIRKEIKQGGRA